MAKARLKEEVREVMVPKFETVKAGLTLELDHDEAEFLADVLGKIGGEPTGRRRFANSIDRAMQGAGYIFDSGRIADSFVGGRGISLL